MRKLLSIIILFITLAIPVVAKADTKSYSIDKLVENVVINELGDIEIHEELTYSFNGDFNGIYRNLLKNGADNFTLLEVTVVDSHGNVTHMPQGGSSENNTYELSEDSSAWKIKLFNKSSNEVKSYIFRYIIHGAAVKTETSGELYWSFYRVENSNNVRNVVLNVALKNTDFNMDKLKYWSYVDGKDFTNSYDSKGLHIKGKELTGQLGIRVLFQPEYLNVPITGNSENRSKVENYSNYNDNNNFTKQYAITNKSDKQGVFVFVFILIITAIVGTLIYHFYQENKKFQDELNDYRSQNIHFNQEICTSPPSDLPPALVHLLVYDKYLSIVMIPSTLFYLSKRGYYTLEKRDFNKTGLFKSTQEEDLAFIRNYLLPMPESPHLQFFINWLSKYEYEGCFTLKSIEKQVSNMKGALDFKNQFSEWENILSKEGSTLGFYTIIHGKQVLTNRYYDEQLKWLAFKRFLVSHMDNISDSTVIENLDDSLIYAQTLKIGSDKLKSFSNKLNNYSSYDGDIYNHNLYNQNMYQYYPFFFMNMHMWDDINNHINQNSSSDSGTSGFTGGDGGSFGGFSDGGGFSGGGGGDSGAF